MALKKLWTTLRVYAEQFRAECDFKMGGGVADLPSVGSAVTWVTRTNGQAIGGGWAIASRDMTPSQIDTCHLVARVPGYDWTYLGLRPIQHAAMPYDIWFFGSAAPFSNWVDGDVIDETSLLAYEIEFVDTVQHKDWQWRTNGPFPTGFSAWLPDSGAARWTCSTYEIKGELAMDAISGVSTLLWRHFVTLRLAPSTTAGKKLTYNYAAWGA